MKTNKNKLIIKMNLLHLKIITKMKKNYKHHLRLFKNNKLK